MYLLKQITTINDPINDCSPTFAKTLYYVVVGISLPISYMVNWIRFIVYKNWLLNSGIVTYDTEEARYGHGCLTTQASKDDALDDFRNGDVAAANSTSNGGNIQMTYSIMNDTHGEDEVSYKFPLPDHNANTTNDKQRSMSSSSPPWAQV